MAAPTEGGVSSRVLCRAEAKLARIVAEVDDLCATLRPTMELLEASRCLHQALVVLFEWAACSPAEAQIHARGSS